MRTTPFQFKGPCSACGKDARSNLRGGVKISVMLGGTRSDWLCLTCAKRLAGMLLNAVDKCREKIRAGMTYRCEKWQKSAPTVTQ